MNVDYIPSVSSIVACALVVSTEEVAGAVVECLSARGTHGGSRELEVSGEAALAVLVAIWSHDAVARVAEPEVTVCNLIDGRGALA